jgi:predicted nucleic acid-binding protein
VSVYVETSAVAKLLVEEGESAALADDLDVLHSEGTELVASVLLETELRRTAVRNEAISQSEVTDLLARFQLLDPDRALFTEAGLLPGRNLRSLDALHTAAALRAEADAMVTYDTRQAEAARNAGLPVLTPVLTDPSHGGAF